MSLIIKLSFVATPFAHVAFGITQEHFFFCTKIRFSEIQLPLHEQFLSGEDA
jgi:hypothetical protein